MKNIIKDRRAGFTDLFLFIIVALVLLFVSGMFIYMGITISDTLHENMDDMPNQKSNYSEVIDSSIGQVNTAYHSLYWLSIVIIVAMIISIFMGSYLVNTKPIFFVPYIFITIIAILVSAGISNAYTEVTSNELLASTFAGFIGSNFIMYYLPIWVTVIGFVGGIIMFVSMRAGQEVAYQ